MISLGIIGEYLARIYEEVKGRPRYLVEESIGSGEANQDSGGMISTDKDNLGGSHTCLVFYRSITLTRFPVTFST